jgi:hypothetical protein
VKVLTSQQAAEDEVLRLNHINADNSCKYFWCTSRLIEQSAEVGVMEILSQLTRLT